MNDLSSLLRVHAKKYPLMQPIDALKLLYQNEFGGGHIIKDPAASLEYLKREHAATPQTEKAPLCEDIGNELVRLYLNGIPTTSLITVNRIFVASATSVQGDLESYLKKIEVLKSLTQSGEMPFSMEEFIDTFCKYSAEGYPMVSHSDIYRESYAPAYRVIQKKYAQFLPLIFELDRRIASQGFVVLAIDGMCGSGKTTLSQTLSSIYDSATVHMDDFFLPPELKTEKRLSEPGGNIFYERFIEEVLPVLGTGQEFTYARFDCQTGSYHEKVLVKAAPLTVVEGSYCLHAKLGDYYDIAVYLSCDSEEQMRRLTERCNFPPLLKRFEQEWIPMEHFYCEKQQVKKRCDFVFETL